jgi:hypothetical protein
MSDNLPNNREAEQDPESCGKVRKSRSKLMLILLAAVIGLPLSVAKYISVEAENQRCGDCNVDSIVRELNDKATKSAAPDKADPADKKHDQSDSKKKGGKKGKKNSDSDIPKIDDYTGTKLA